MGPTNAYTPTWFAAFMAGIPGAPTEREVAGLARRLPLPAYRAVLDICCGPGRHAALLAARGYAVTGVDRDPAALAAARERAPGARFVALDQRHVGRVGGRHDAAVILWQSFGYFDPAGNDHVLRQVAGVLRPGGRLALDVYHPGYVAEHQGRRGDGRPGVVAITNTLANGRLVSTIEYVDGSAERMDFELFAPEALAERAAPFGFGVVGACRWWDERRPPDPAVARYRLILELRHPPTAATVYPTSSNNAQSEGTE
jgi:SAM-dependent methyltransferase